MFFLPIFSSKMPQGGDQRKQPTSVNLFFDMNKANLRKEKGDLCLSNHRVLIVDIDGEHSVCAEEKDVN